MRRPLLPQVEVLNAQPFVAMVHWLGRHWYYREPKPQSTARQTAEPQMTEEVWETLVMALRALDETHGAPAERINDAETWVQAEYGVWEP
ncbi:MAG TPA: hypothetical protein VMT27_06625 [Actinomycetes bacterium]|nr:hypothetical protein [Actinomycetes bacterium]